ncbi:unnamed protein product [Allacma fusca]|uniref:Uncharacterized protein n=1 Tax=Allacma fusca TaxID=39272 RepID=A0A8J2KWF1_9HEXA|nr:unnamed protein product [Allacma fusca]
MAKTNRNPYKASIFKQHQKPLVIFGAIFVLVLLLLTFFIGIPLIIREQIKLEARLEVGPYVWEEKRVRNVLEVNEEKDYVRYTETLHYYFREDLSVGSQEDKMDIVNIPFVALSTILYQKVYSFIANSAIDHFMEEEKENIVQRGVKVREFIFDGVKLNPMYESLANLGGIQLPAEFADGTFAMYNRKNGTETPEYIVNRGVKNVTKFGDLMAFDKKPELTWWTNSSLPAGAQQYCNKINGSDGGMFPPFVTKDRTIYIFPYEICRNIYLDFVKEVNYQGVPAYYFKIPDRMLANPREVPTNDCYLTSYGHGLPDPPFRGAYRMFTCKGGVPLLLSKPHYLGASDAIRNGINGMKPDVSIHDVELEVEPNSGMLLRINRRIQINLEYIPLPDITAFENVNHTAIPVFWVDEAIKIDDASLEDLYYRLIIPLKIVAFGKWIVVGVTLVCILSALLQMLFTNQKDKEPAPLIPNGTKLGETLLPNCEKS